MCDRFAPKVSRFIGAALLCSLSALVPACSGDGADAATGALDLDGSRTSVLWETVLWEDFGIIGALPPHIGVADAVAEGERVLVVVQNAFGTLPELHGEPVCRGECEAIRPQVLVDGPTATQWLLQSEDGGETWAMSEFVPAPDAPEPYVMDWDVSFFVHPDGDALLQIPSARGANTAIGFQAFDSRTAQSSPHPVLGQFVLDHHLRARGPLISGWTETFYGTDRWFNAFHYDTRDRTHHKEITGEPIGVSLPGGPLPSAVMTTTADGRLWWSYYIDGYGNGCVGWARPAEFSEPGRGPCMALDVLPLPLRDPVAIHAFGTGAVGVIGEWEGHVWAMPLPTQPDRPLAPHLLVDLGPGSAVPDTGFHQLFGGALAISAPDGVRYVELGWDGEVEELVFPSTPCRGDSCGDASRLERAIPRGGDTWLLLYVVDVAPGNDRQMKMVALETSVSRRPHVAEQLDIPEPTSPMASYPQARPAVGLARACQARAACTGERYYNCVAEWEVLHEGCPALDALLAVDLSLPDACEQLAALRPDPACANRPAPGAATCESPSIRCEGDRIVSCYSGPNEVVRDCSIRGLTCAEERDGVRCVSRAPVEESDCGLMVPYRVQCLAERYLTWCEALDERQWLDCGEIGFGGCEPNEFADAACAQASSTEGPLDDVASASEIEQRCWDEVACMLEDGALGAEWTEIRSVVFGCIRRWSSMLHAGDDRVSEFGAIGAGECAALRAADPHGFPPPDDLVPCSGPPACYDDARPTCAFTPPIEGFTAWCPLDSGGACDLDARGRGGCMDDAEACPEGDDAGGCDERGRAFDCAANWKLDCGARGLDCVESTGPGGQTVGRCVDPAWTCDEAGMKCADGVSLNCDSSGLPRDATECDRLGMQCGESGYCIGVGHDSGASGSIWGRPRCEEGLLLWASYGKRSLDCTVLGASCFSDEDGAWCAR